MNLPGQLLEIIIELIMCFLFKMEICKADNICVYFSGKQNNHAANAGSSFVVYFNPANGVFFSSVRSSSRLHLQSRETETYVE